VEEKLMEHTPEVSPATRATTRRRFGSTTTLSPEAALNSAAERRPVSLSDRRILVTLAYPLMMRTVSSILVAVARDYPDARIGEGGEVWDRPPKRRATSTIKAPKQTAAP